MRFHVKRLNPPQRKIYGFRDWHVREVFKGEFREL